MKRSFTRCPDNRQISIKDTKILENNIYLMNVYATSSVYLFAVSFIESQLLETIFKKFSKTVPLMMMI